jgi:exopolyphosphatase/guanosine-5'-triphosphate,3'-diphosphate pyrophosphatase
MKAIIDLGTNTFHLLIAEVANGEIIEIHKNQIPVKIGEGGINQQFIAPQAFQRGLDALSVFRQTLNTYGIGQTTAFATSALRDANNGIEFIEQAQHLYQIQVELISGEQEAELIYNGVRNAFELPDTNVLVMDIGGGSVEFIIGKQDQIFWRKSYPIGAARLIERFHKTDPMSDEELISLQSYLIHNMKELRDAIIKYPTTILIGSAGSFETLTEVIQKDLQIPFDTFAKHADEIPLASFAAFYETITTRNAKERAKLHGMADFRVEMIVVATILMDVVIKRFDIDRLIASHYSLKEGILFS